MEKIDWLFELKSKVPLFLEKMKGQKPGFFRYSLSGDLYGEKDNWGLGNAVFATKIYYTLGLLDKLSSEEKKHLSNFIESFQKESGFFFDPLVQKKSRFINIATALKNLDFNNFFGQQTKIAETRQSLSALKLLGMKPEFEFGKFPPIEKEIEKYLKRLDWTKPWGAGSHFSHLLFFLENSSLKNKNGLIDFTIEWIINIQDKDTGSWFKSNPSPQQKINGAMKIITGLKAIDKINFNYPEKLVDLCLSIKNDEHACDNFNIVYVLKYANELTSGKYRYEEIKNFCYDRLDTYKKYYFPKIGGFSFKKNKANDIYYGARITKGLNEPDIHGTVMFLWGISVIAQILNINDKLEFKEFIT